MKAWKEFEERVREILEYHSFSTKSNFIFKDERGRAEIDILAERFGIILAIDAKRYSEGWYRASAIKREAKKHFERCKRYERIAKKRIIPIIVSLIDDSIYLHENCLVVPFEKFNDFLNNIHFYLEELL